MKDSEFIELLNLYLDHEISAADAARLEAEVQANPTRRRRYEQYCRMQKACKLVVAEYEAAQEAAGDSDRKVVPFDPAAIAAAAAQPRRASGLYTIGTFAAVAACIAIIFVGRSRQQQDGLPQVSAPVAQAVPAVTPPADNTAAASMTRLVSLPPRASTLTPSPALFTDRNQAEAESADLAATNQLAWINSVQLAPVQQRVTADDLHFAATLRSEGRPLGNRAVSPPKPREPAEETVTFRLTK